MKTLLTTTKITEELKELSISKGFQSIRRLQKPQHTLAQTIAYQLGTDYHGCLRTEALWIITDDETMHNTEVYQAVITCIKSGIAIKIQNLNNQKQVMKRVKATDPAIIKKEYWSIMSSVISPIDAVVRVDSRYEYEDTTHYVYTQAANSDVVLKRLYGQMSGKAVNSMVLYAWSFYKGSEAYGLALKCFEIGIPLELHFRKDIYSWSGKRLSANIYDDFNDFLFNIPEMDMKHYKTKTGDNIVVQNKVYTKTVTTEIQTTVTNNLAHVYARAYGLDMNTPNVTEILTYYINNNIDMEDNYVPCTCGVYSRSDAPCWNCGDGYSDIVSLDQIIAKQMARDYSIESEEI